MAHEKFHYKNIEEIMETAKALNLRLPFAGDTKILAQPLKIRNVVLQKKEGAGIGGGDIKLAGVMGLIYGPSRMLAVLLIASGLAACVSLAAGRKKGMLSLPFVPFLMAGSLAVTITAIL